MLCTHLHVDHVGWNTRLENGRWVPTFPRARYLFARTEYEPWMREGDDGAQRWSSLRRSRMRSVVTALAVAD